MKKYVKPEMEITEFDVEDVITTSDNNQGEETTNEDELSNSGNGG